MSNASPTLLVVIFVVWTLACIAVGCVFFRRAPAVSLAMIGSLFGAVSGFLIGNADGPAEVPAYTAVWASVGLFAFGLLGLITSCTPRATSRSLHRAAFVVLVAAPFAAAALTVLVQLACPLYVSGKGSGFCNYQGVDLLGGWVSGVIVGFLVDAAFVAGLLFVSAWQIRRSDARDVADGAERKDQPTQLF
jgi:hypothetical protein